jgi:hypothetical protein
MLATVTSSRKERLTMRRFAMWTSGLTWALVLMTIPSVPVAAGSPTAARWSVVVSTAPQFPQDVWFAATGNNVDGWKGGGSICLNHLAQGIEGGEQVTFLIDAVEGGIFGVDGSPVPAGTYTFPGIEIPSRDYTVTIGTTYYVILDAYIVQSKLPGFEVGDTVGLMFMWDFAPGRTDREVVAWIDVGSGFNPLLNEGTMMANVRLRR